MSDYLTRLPRDLCGDLLLFFDYHQIMDLNTIVPKLFTKFIYSTFFWKRKIEELVIWKESIHITEPWNTYLMALRDPDCPYYSPGTTLNPDTYRFRASRAGADLIEPSVAGLCEGGHRQLLKPLVVNPDFNRWDDLVRYGLHDMIPATHPNYHDIQKVAKGEIPSIVCDLLFLTAFYCGNTDCLEYFSSMHRGLHYVIDAWRYEGYLPDNVIRWLCGKYGEDAIVGNIVGRLISCGRVCEAVRVSRLIGKTREGGMDTLASTEYRRVMGC